MNRKILSLVLSVILGISMIPTFAKTSIPENELKTPDAPWILHNEENNLLMMVYHVPSDLMDISDAFKRGNNDTTALGVESYQMYLETDVKIDDGEWQYTIDWDSPDWWGLRDKTGVSDYVFSTWYPINESANRSYDARVLSWLAHVEDGNVGYLKDIVTSSETDEGVMYSYDFDNHTMYIRNRMCIKYRDTAESDWTIVFSDWSKEASIGKDADEFSYTPSVSYEGLEVSKLNIRTIEHGNISYHEFSYYLDLPETLYRDLAYYEEVLDEFKPLELKAQIKINENDWKDLDIGENDLLTNGYKYAISGTNDEFSDEDIVFFRVGVAKEGEDQYSWSNILSYPDPEIISSLWAKNEIKRAMGMGLVSSDMRDQDLTKSITREEFAEISTLVYEKLVGDYTGPIQVMPFTDTTNTEVAKAYNIGIVDGVGDNLFMPDKALTREQAATMLTRVYKKSVLDGWKLSIDTDYDEAFRELYHMPDLFEDDKNISSWAKDSVYFMKSKGIILGVGDNLFAPRAVTEEEAATGYGTLTREQAIAIALRMVETLGA